MTLRISVIGTSYLGANTAAGMAEFGFEVVGVDIDESRVKLLNEGRAPLYEPGLDPLLKKHTDSGRLRFTTAYTEIADWADVHFICVGTPQSDGDYAADLSQVNAVADLLAPHLTRPALIVGRSTVPVGTAANLHARFKAEAPAGDSALNRSCTWAAVPTGTVDRPTISVGSVRCGASMSTTDSTWDRSAA